MTTYIRHKSFYFPTFDNEDIIVIQTFIYFFKLRNALTLWKDALSTPFKQRQAARISQYLFNLFHRFGDSDNTRC